MGSATKQARKQSKSNGMLRTRKRKQKPTKNAVAAKPWLAPSQPSYSPHRREQEILRPVGELPEPALELLPLPSALQALQERLRLLWQGARRMVGLATLLLLCVLLLSSYGCGTAPGAARMENPFSQIPAELLKRPLPPVPLSEPSSTTMPKTPHDAAKPAGNLER